jgi:hypothetical protein
LRDMEEVEEEERGTRANPPEGLYVMYVALQC